MSQGWLQPTSSAVTPATPSAGSQWALQQQRSGFNTSGNAFGTQGGGWAESSKTVNNTDGSVFTVTTGYGTDGLPFTAGTYAAGGGGLFGSAAAAGASGGFAFGSGGPGGGMAQATTFANGGVTSFASSFPAAQQQQSNNNMDNSDRLPFARMRILEAMARAASALKLEECVLTLRAAHYDFLTEWPSEWPQKDEHLGLLRAVAEVAHTLSKDPGTARSEDVWKSVQFPAQGKDTKLTHLLRIILKRLTECCYQRVACATVNKPLLAAPKQHTTDFSL